MNLSEKLTIASLVLGGLGSLLFVVYKAKSGKKNSLIANSSKILIAISLILLTIAVLFLSKSKEPFTSMDGRSYVIKPPLPQPFLVEISNLNPSTYYIMYANDLNFGTVKSDTNGVINFKNIISLLPGLPIPLYAPIRISPSDSKASFTTDPKPKFVFASLDKSNTNFTFIGHTNDKQGPTEICKRLTYKYTVEGKRVSNFGSPTLTHPNHQCPT
jgi:hypothetical protein